MTKKKPGRPSKYEPERAERVLRAISTGASRLTAAQFGGIGERTLYDWMARYPQFSQSIKMADAEAELGFIGVVVNAARGFEPILDGEGRVARVGRLPEWQAAAWWLERRHPENWRRRTEVEYVAAGDEKSLAAQEYKQKVRELYGLDVAKMTGEDDDDSGGGTVH